MSIFSNLFNNIKTRNFYHLKQCDDLIQLFQEGILEEENTKHKLVHPRKTFKFYILGKVGEEDVCYDCTELYERFMNMDWQGEKDIVKIYRCD